MKDLLGCWFLFSHPASGPSSLQHLEGGCHSISGREAINDSLCPLVCTCRGTVWCLIFWDAPLLFSLLSSEPNANRTL